MRRAKVLGGLSFALMAAFAVSFVAFPDLRGYLPFKATLEGNTPDILSSATLLNPEQDPQGKVDDQTPMKAVVGLNLRDESSLNELLAQQRDPSSSEYLNYIKDSQESIARWAPTTESSQMVCRYLERCGLKATPSADRVLVSATGTKEQMEQAFGVTIGRYRTKELHDHKLVTVDFLSNTSNPRVPSYLSDIVGSVSGLYTHTDYRCLSTPPVDGGDPNATQTKDKPLPLTPKKVASVYDFPSPNNISPGALTGKGCTVDIVTAYDCLDSDLAEYWSQFGIKRTGQVKRIEVGFWFLGVSLGAESTLDVQQVGAHAPGANIHVFMGADARFTTFEEMESQVQVDNPNCVSISWGLCEKGAGAAHTQTEHALFKLMSVQGIAIFSASGDDGAYDCNRVDEDEGLSVDYPSSDDQVTAVGGTSLRLNSDLQRTSETVWGGSGGGISILWDQPSYQKIPGIPASDKRQTPDVALVADPHTGYSIRYNGHWRVSGGTSFAAPVWAAYWAQVEEAAGRRVRPNDVIYRIANSKAYSQVFHDITEGDTGSHGRDGYSATAGWDHTTGWGVPKGTALMQAVVNHVRKHRK